MSKRKMSLQAATEFVPDDLPDGAYWAMAHEIAGGEYGECWDELDGIEDSEPKPAPKQKTICPQCHKKVTIIGLNNHIRDKHHG